MVKRLLEDFRVKEEQGEELCVHNEVETNHICCMHVYSIILHSLCVHLLTIPKNLTTPSIEII